MNSEAIRSAVLQAPQPQLTALRLIAAVPELTDEAVCEALEVDRLGDIPARQGLRRSTGQLPPSTMHRALAMVRLGRHPRQVASDLAIGYSTVMLWMSRAHLRWRDVARKGGERSG